ncbi:MAG: hypothetical protein LUF92_07265, partial [Clostridiales bacterium]|nr:hypothetical protein [Clostridiales bacterium]
FAKKKSDAPDDKAVATKKEPEAPDDEVVATRKKSEAPDDGEVAKKKKSEADIDEADEAAIVKKEQVVSDGDAGIVKSEGMTLEDFSGDMDPEKALEKLRKVVLAGEQEQEDDLEQITRDLADGFDFDEIESDENVWGQKEFASGTETESEGITDDEPETTTDEGSGDIPKTETGSERITDSEPETAADEGSGDIAETETDSEEEYQYVNPYELVLGEHTQAEVEEAIENLNTLGLEGDIYERAKRMLLLEMAGSEGELEKWLEEQENGKRKKAAVSALDEENAFELTDFDEDSLEQELALAIDEDFAEDDTKKEAEPAADKEIAKDNQEKEPKHAMNLEYAEDHLEKETEVAVDGEIAEDDPEKETEVAVDGEIAEDDLKNETKPAVDREIAEDCQAKAVESEQDGQDDEVVSQVDDETEYHRRRNDSRKAAKHSPGKKRVIRKKEKRTSEKPKVDSNQDMENSDSGHDSGHVEEKGYQVSLQNPFVLKNSASYMDQFEEYITDTQENRKLSTGFRRLDAMLRFGLHKGSYFIDAEPQYLKNSFMQQLADRAAEGGVDVLYISTELSRYDLMVDTISRLSYEIHQGDPDKSVSVMSIMTGEEGANLASLKDELNWYRGRISEHLYILDQEAVAEYMESIEEVSAGDILTGLIRSIVREGAHKPVVFIDNIENILSVEDSEDMRPLMEGIRKLAKELGIPIIMSYGYAQAENETELDLEEKEFHSSLGDMCDVYMELSYARMITEDSEELTQEDIQEMMEEGETLLIDVMLHRNRRPMRASCQIQGTPKFNHFEE